MTRTHKRTNRRRRRRRSRGGNPLTGATHAVTGAAGSATHAVGHGAKVAEKKTKSAVDHVTGFFKGLVGGRRSRRSRRSRRRSRRRRQRGGGQLQQWLYPIIPNDILDVGFSATNGLKNMYAGYVGQRNVASSNPMVQPIGKDVKVIGSTPQSDMKAVFSGAPAPTSA